MALKTKPKPKSHRAKSRPKSRATRKPVSATIRPTPVVVTMRRKLVNYRTGDVHRGANGEPVTWASDDPAAETALMAKYHAGGGWCLVPAEYQFQDKGPEGKVWR